MTKRKTRINRITAMIFVIAFVVGFISYYAGIYDDVISGGIRQVISGNGVDYVYAIDGDPQTSWDGSVVGEQGDLIFQYPEEKRLIGMKMLLEGGEIGQEISYITSIQISDDGIHWTDFIGADQTDYFSNKKWFEWDFEPTPLKYMRVRARVSFSERNFRIYEVIPEFEEI